MLFLERMKKLNYLPLLFLLGCFSPTQEQALIPRDPWAIRSVLDGKPRMLSLAMNKEVNLAYDLANGQLFKIWKGGIHLDGAAYTDVKTVQPTSWGKDYELNFNSHIQWILKQKERNDTANIRFKGYDIIDQQIHLRYQLNFPNQSFFITESPGIQEVNGEKRLTRKFRIETLPPSQLGFKDQDQFLAFDSKKNILLSKALPHIEDFPKPKREITGNVGKYWLDKTGCNTCHKEDEFTVGPGYRQIAGKYENTAETRQKLIQKVISGGKGVWGENIMTPHPHLGEGDIGRMISYILSLAPKKDGPTRKKQSTPAEEKILKPGFGAALTKVHPAFDLMRIRPQSFKPRVGGMDFLPDGSLLVSTWDSVGGVYRLSGLEKNDSSKVKIQRIAEGLSEPLGLKVVEGEIYVLQKHELTQLIDLNDDGKIDRYESICNTFGVTTDFHEFAYGLEYKDGYFYANLGLAMRLMSHELNYPDRGKTIRIAKDGSYEHVISGIRQANGLGLGPDNELFISENQGQWVPACKLIQVVEGEFHGCLYHSEIEEGQYPLAKPAVWLPHNEIGNSPGQPLMIHKGPFKGQMFLAEVTHGGIKRVFLEKIGGRFQGCVFRFTQGLEAGINRLAWGPNGGLYAGGVGMNGNWGIPGKQFGLQKLAYNGKSVFEMLAIRLQKEGLEIEFTEPIAGSNLPEVSEIFAQQWNYTPTAAYGGPKMNLETLPIKQMDSRENGKKLFLHLPDMKEDRVVYIRLPEEMKSADGQELWSGEGWYYAGELVN